MTLDIRSPCDFAPPPRRVPPGQLFRVWRGSAHPNPRPRGSRACSVVCLPCWKHAVCGGTTFAFLFATGEALDAATGSPRPLQLFCVTRDHPPRPQPKRVACIVGKATLRSSSVTNTPPCDQPFCLSCQLDCLDASRLWPAHTAIPTYRPKAAHHSAMPHEVIVAKPMDGGVG